MPHDQRLSRRTVVGGLGLGAASLATGIGLPLRSAEAKTLTVGFIYVGAKDDYGYNQAHAEAAAMLKKMPGMKIVEEEKVPETDDVQKTMESMIQLDGATLLFPTSFGYFDPYMLRMANKYPKIEFRHCGGLWTDKDPKNAGSYFGYIGMCQYLERHRRRPHHQEQEARLRRRQADPAGAGSTSTASPSAPASSTRPSPPR